MKSIYTKSKYLQMFTGLDAGEMFIFWFTKVFNLDFCPQKPLFPDDGDSEVLQKLELPFELAQLISR